MNQLFYKFSAPDIFFLNMPFYDSESPFFQKNTAAIFTLKLDVDPQRDDDASPMSTYRCMLRPT